MHDSLNLNSITKISPKPDSWNRVLMRIEAERKARKIIPFRLYSALSVAASLLFIVSGILLGFSTNQTNVEQSFELLDNSETLSWFNSLGKGESIEKFSTILDEYK